MPRTSGWSVGPVARRGSKAIDGELMSRRDPTPGDGRFLVCVIDDDENMRAALETLLRSARFDVRTFATPSAYLQAALVEATDCLILDVQIGDENGLAFQEALLNDAVTVPVVFITGYGDLPMAVRGMKAGATNFLAKPFDDEDLLAAVAEAASQADRRREDARSVAEARERYAGLSQRERQVMELVTAGLMNKQIAGRLGITEITVKIHRGNVMRKMKARTLVDLVRLAALAQAIDAPVLGDRA